MDCREARRLLDQGVTPGSARPERAALGFHLAGCAACRAYRAGGPDALLAALLLEPAPEAPPPPPRRARSRPTRYIKTISLALVGIAAALGLLLAGRMAITLAAIAGNVAAMSAPVTPAGDPAQITALPAELVALIPPTLPPPSWARDTAAPANAPNISPTGIATARPSVTPVSALLETYDRLPQPALPAPPPATAVAPPTVTPIPLGSGAPAATPALAPLPTLPADAGRAPIAGQAITILMLGIDRRPGETFPPRADAVIIARIEPERRRIAMLSLPRDLVAPIPGWGWARINSATVYGELNPALGGGVALMRQTVSEFLDLPIDYVVTVDFNGFIGAVDALGGVTIDVPVELYDPEYPTMDYGYTVAHFLPGPQLMDGARALMYARIRHMDSDWERMKRQQAVIVAAMARVREQNTLGRLESIAALTTALRSYVTTDIPETQMLGLAWAFREFTPDLVERYSLDANYVSIGAPGDPYAQYALPGAVEMLRAQLLGE